ncbi:class I SAM-dependent methyltransferase [Geomonas azotofigens]|uniref:class I SAM-dependent methyltransferase n=1 Tax=Geomonas azotofigens TaxID=2843196 RepID=UPI001C0F79A3|nr:class I SAM-dependent methyltransferase [Geomonas azotofigens]MBU5612557.1 class I SAM-dependent methyltransferase [Geomonas azotofigens]
MAPPGEALMFFCSYPTRFYSLDAPSVPLTGPQAAALERFRTGMNEGLYALEPAPCICGSEDGVLLARRDRYGLEVDTYLCRHCGVLRTSPRLSPESLSRFYDSDYREIYGGEETASDAFFAEQIAHGRSILDSVLHNIAGDLAGAVVFDVGCGAGGVLIPFRESGCLVYGCDHGGRYLEYGRSQGLRLEHGGAAELKQHGKAKVVILSHVLEHFPDPRAELALLSSLLEDDGYLYIELPGVFNIHNVYRDFLLYLQNAHLYHFTLSTLSSLLADAGFQLVFGYENVVALFKKGSGRPVQVGKREYAKVLCYLYSVELSRLAIFRKLPQLVARIIGWTYKRAW